MEQDHIPLTALDQMVGGNQEQLLKALIPYLPPGPQQFLSLFAKAKEFSNTIALFGYGHPTPMQAASVSSQPLDILQDVRQYCYGSCQKSLDQMINMAVMLEMVKVMNSSPSTDNCEAERQ